jgi:hypothetical protein
MKSPILSIVACFTLFAPFPVLAESYFGDRDTPNAANQPSPPLSGFARAKYVITVSDDFVVDVYHNGKLVPLSDRKMISETFGATSERISIDVKKGDWLVFNVVNNRLRWGGARYFAAAGMLDAKTIGFASKLNSSNWTSCDNPSLVEAFIALRAAPGEAPVKKITKLWGDGNRLIKEHVGSKWNGDPVWGESANTWIKVRVDE